MAQKEGFGELLKKYRKRLGLTQKELAARVDLTPGYISKLEREDRPPPAHTAKLLADHLGLEGEERAAFLEAAHRLYAIHREGMGLEATLARASDLPQKRTRFLTGRDEEIQDIFERLTEAGVIINITGEPAIGKTTVALEVAHRYRDQKRVILWGDAREGTAESVAQVEALIWNSIVKGAMPGSKERKQERLSAALSEYGPLIVLDNLESAKEFSEILEFASQISRVASVLITSQRWIPERLGNNVSLSELPEHEGIQLFEKIGAAFGRQPVTEEDHLAIEIICTDFLEGHPGAIEIAASLWQGWPLKAILNGLEERAMDTLEDDLRPESDINRSMRISIELSYDLLHEENLEVWELFPRLSVFQASFTSQAAGAVVGISNVFPALEFLVDRSLVRFDGRRHSLHSVVREFGLEKLREERGEYELRAAQYFLDFAQEHETDFDRLDEEKGNLFATMDWAEAHEEHRSIALELVYLLFSFMERRGLWTERRRRVQRALEIAELIGEKEEIMRLCYVLGKAYQDERDDEKAQKYIEKGLALAQQLGQPKYIGGGLSLLAQLVFRAGDYLRVVDLVRQALGFVKQAGDMDQLLQVLSLLGSCEIELGNHDKAYYFLEEGLALAYQIEDTTMMGILLEELCLLDIEAQDFSRAEERAQEYERLARQTGDPISKGGVLRVWGTLLWDTSRPEEAKEYFMAAASHFEQAAMPMGALEVRETLLLAAMLLKDLSLAEEQLEAMASTLFDLGDDERAAFAFCRLGLVQEELNKLKEAKISYEEALSLYTSLGMLDDPRAKEIAVSLEGIRKRLSD